MSYGPSSITANFQRRLYFVAKIRRCSSRSSRRGAYCVRLDDQPRDRERICTHDPSIEAGRVDEVFQAWPICGLLNNVEVGIAGTPGIKQVPEGERLWAKRHEHAMRPQRDQHERLPVLRRFACAGAGMENGFWLVAGINRQNPSEIGGGS